MSFTQADPPQKLNPWLFIPLLYFMQAIPVTLIQEVAVFVYKDLGIENELITRWTSLIALPWSLQMLLGPLVDLNATKRWWILAGQGVIALGLIGAAFAFQVAQAFTLSLVILGLSAVFSALCNIATDGFAILSMEADERARFAGIMSTCYRLGRLFCAAGLVFVAGLMMKLPPLEIQGEHLPFIGPQGSGPISRVALIVDSGVLKAAGNLKYAGDPITIPPGTFRLAVRSDGNVLATTLKGEETVGKIALQEGARLTVGAPSEARDPRQVWTLVFLGGALLYTLGHLASRRFTPKPSLDSRAEPNPHETRRNLIRTVALLLASLGGYFGINALVRLTAHGLWFALDGTVAQGGAAYKGLQGWMLPEDDKIPFLRDLSFGGVGTELFQLSLCIPIVAIGVLMVKRSIVGSEMGKAIGSFVRQPGFPAIFLFILFYRFPEAMVGKISPLFLKDGLDKGGLAIDNAQLGIVNGLLGVVGIILGGIVGGFAISKIGLRKSFMPLMLAMNLPNVLYLLLTQRVLPMAMIDLSWPGPLNLTLGAILFVDQFGYGFGFSGYMVYLMWVARRGDFPTSHYAICTGMGALCIAIAGVLSGTIQSNFGYLGVYISVLVLSVPALASLLMIPLDESHKQIRVEVD